MNDIHFEVKFVPAGTGSAVWDNPFPNSIVQRFMPQDRQHGPMIGILHLGALRPTPNVLRDLVVAIGEDVRDGRYGNFTFVVSSADDATRTVVSNIASAQDLPLFISSSSTDLEQAEPAGILTMNERETLNSVLSVGGTVTAAELGKQLRIGPTAAGNRLISLHKKGYLQRVERPHPSGDYFVDPRSVRFPVSK